MEILPLALMFVVVYFLMIRPQMQKGKQEKKFLHELKKGTRVVTKGGIHGKVLELNTEKDITVLETGAGKLTFQLSSISYEMSQKIQPNKNEAKTTS